MKPNLLAMEQNYASNYLGAIGSVTTEQLQAAEKMFIDEEQPPIMKRDQWGDSATITITGPLSPNGPDWFDRLFGFGGTSYKAIVEAAQELENDPTIKKVTLIMDTPGGYVSGVDSARAALASLAKEKELVAENHGLIASAGYYLASAADKIIAKDRFAKTGSIGVIITTTDYTKALEKFGIKRINIVSQNAPNKRPDPATKEGRSVIQDEIDATERVFIHTIAEGRKVTVAHVKANFGRGGVFIAQDPDPKKADALSVGMIDSVDFNMSEVSETEQEESEELSNEESNKATAANNQNDEESTTMDLAKLKADHPQLFAEAVALGASQERERVSAHLILGEASGDMDLAIKSVKDGDEVTATVQAKHTAAHMKRKETADREGENVEDIETNADDSLNSDESMASEVAKLLGVDNA